MVLHNQGIQAMALYSTIMSRNLALHPPRQMPEPLERREIFR